MSLTSDLGSNWCHRCRSHNCMCLSIGLSAADSQRHYNEMFALNMRSIAQDTSCLAGLSNGAILVSNGSNSIDLSSCIQKETKLKQSKKLLLLL